MNSNQRKMKLFRELVKLTYKNNLKDNIDEVPNVIKEEKTNVAAIKNEILLAMGLNPTAHADTELSREVEAALNINQVEFPLVTVNNKICDECNTQNTCQTKCVHDEEENTSTSKHAIIEYDKCISCGKCIPSCPLGAINDKIEFIPMTKYLNKGIPIYAAVAPAIAGQYGKDVTMGKLRSALKAIGFADMLEVALFADLLTIKEADEFNRLVKTEDDFLITSCCCPIWVNLLSKHYEKLYDKLTKTVSPMIAAGRIIKTIFPNSKTVFIGPCVAKKAEAKNPELAGAIDYVITFDELDQVFKALEMDLSQMPEDNKEQSSYGGRTYARTGGVSQAVNITLQRINPNRKIKFKSIQCDGVSECKAMLDKLKSGKIEANFIEGMGCQGGCVGGPKRNREVEEGKECVEEYGLQATYKNPIDNISAKHIVKYLKSMEENQFDKLLIRE